MERNEMERNGTNGHFNSYYTKDNKYNDNKEMKNLVVYMIEVTINLTRERNANIDLYKLIIHLFDRFCMLVF